KHLGLIRYATLPTWIDEGYADYIAQDSTVSREEGIALLKSDKSVDWKSINNFVYGQVVKFALETKKWSFEDLVNHGSDFEKLRIEFFESLKNL
ncbi:MAG: hypothetical protein KDD22_03495, partial [Bdellovibrionales bacterium]|nr:hypothetical protein [Bdellovibrionales bacterium]